MAKTIIAGAIGECVHVAGITNFLRLAEACGWKTIFLGPAVPIEDVIRIAAEESVKSDPRELLVGVSYRLTPENGERLLGQFAEEAASLHEIGVHFAFGGTPPVAERAAKLNFFEKIFSGGEPPDDVIAYLKGATSQIKSMVDFPQKTIDRIRWKSPYPILRHHFGLPTMEATLDGVSKIAEAEALDLISLGTDQDAQEFFFHPEKQDIRRKGAGGVPIRTENDLMALYAASRRGNYPLMRAYSGTDDFIRYAKLLTETIHNAWCAIPLFWFNQMDGRGPWDLEGSICEHQKIMVWYGERDIPVELNEPHHWGMRDAPDVIFVVTGYLAAYNAKYYGVKDYIAQMMFNSPPGMSDAMDLAKMLALIEMIGELGYNDNHSGLSQPPFKIWKQTRTGLLSYPLDPDAARGHLASSIYLQMALKPDILHIVGHTEAHHAATAEDIIEDSKIARRAITNGLGAPDMTKAPEVVSRKNELISQAQITLSAIRSLTVPELGIDAFSDASILARAVKAGILDAPQLKNNRFARGKIRSQVMNGACDAVDENGARMSEEIRLDRLQRNLL